MNKIEINQILSQLKLSPQKAKGQNFLIDDDVCRVIVDMLAPHYDHVVEIGPGLGALTRKLIDKGSNLTVVELDRGYARYLQEKHHNINVIEKDFLKYNVPRETTGVISNIPYYITTKIIEKVLIETPNLKSFVFMTQKDVRTRLFAKPNSKEYGPLAIILSLVGKLEEKITVTADKFYPAPNVDSAVFKLTVSDHYIDVKEFYQFLKFSFLHRRKVLMNNLKSKYAEADIAAVYNSLQVNQDVRVEALSPEQLINIWYSLTLNTKSQ